jgi:hypothetical protein
MQEGKTESKKARKECWCWFYRTEGCHQSRTNVRRLSPSHQRMCVNSTSRRHVEREVRWIGRWVQYHTAVDVALTRFGIVTLLSLPHRPIFFSPLSPFELIEVVPYSDARPFRSSRLCRTSSADELHTCPDSSLNSVCGVLRGEGESEGRGTSVP